MRFVETRNGLVNLDHVATITRREEMRPRSGELTVYSLRDTAGRSLGETSDFYPDDLLVTVVPAAVGAFVHVVLEYGNEVQIDQVSVVAWKIRGEDAEPILTDTPTSNQTVLIPQPDGKITFPYDRTFDSLDEARQYFQARAADKDKG